MTEVEFSRRAFMARAGALGIATALAQLPALLDAKGLGATARAATADVTRDTLSGVLAFILPGDDEYSVAQGVSAKGPGAIGAGTLEPFIAALDEFVPASAAGQTATVPASGGVATLLNAYALEVNPAIQGPFVSPFANLPFEAKGECFRRFEADETVTDVVPELKFVAGILPGFVGFMAASEVGVYDPATKELSGRPIAWKLAHYGGPAEGHPELRGYYQGRRRVRGTRRTTKETG
jgi:hypothetical protein